MEIYVIVNINVSYGIIMIPGLYIWVAHHEVRVIESDQPVCVCVCVCVVQRATDQEGQSYAAA